MGITVRATKDGFYGRYRQPDEEFVIENEQDFSTQWMVRLAHATSGKPLPSDGPIWKPTMKQE